jgi:FkbM family methyltransferase
VTELAAHLELLFARLDIDCVVDVGAHLGQFGQLVRGFGYDGPIVSFEPVLPVFAALTKTCTSADERWEAHRLALGSEDGTRAINVPEATDFSSFLTPTAYSLDEFGGHTAVQRREQVAVRRLDAVADEYLPPDGSRLFLKLDTHGFDLEVLRGAEATVERVAAVQTELSFQALYEEMPRYHEITAYLDERGYEVTGFFPVTRDRELRIIEADWVLVRRGL